jgi:hypothetical protein
MFCYEADGVGLEAEEEAGPEAGGEVGLDELEAVIREGVLLYGLGGEVAAADGAFHGAGPAGAGVVTGEVEAWDAGALGRSNRFDAREHREGGSVLGDQAAME